MALTVLALRALGLGDALTAVPALKGLRRGMPGARLVLAAPPEVGGWLRSLGLVDDVLPTQGRAAPPDRLAWPAGAQPPDLAVNLHGRGPQSHRLLRALQPGRLVAFECAEAGFHDGPRWEEDEHEVDRWCRLVRSAGGGCGREDLVIADVGVEPGLSATAAGVASSPVIPSPAVVHPGAASPARRWPAERWAGVVSGLSARGLPVVVTGTPAEGALCAEAASAGGLDLSGRLSLEELAQTVATASVVLCGDTGVAHLATALRRPSVILFGPTSPAHWGPAVDEDLHRVLWHEDVPTSGDPHATVTDPRLQAITVAEVLQAVDGLGVRPAQRFPHP
ncbi:MAG TPA: glycosyltransferase family 9 protein, partial [Dermatophilaceae bacterium]|nr:glycosyltransferase family 9 protein [Dermatophilaceae bacterium]